MPAKDDVGAAPSHAPPAGEHRLLVLLDLACVAAVAEEGSASREDEVARLRAEKDELQRILEASGALAWLQSFSPHTEVALLTTSSAKRAKTSIASFDEEKAQRQQQQHLLCPIHSKLIIFKF